MTNEDSMQGQHNQTEPLPESPDPNTLASNPTSDVTNHESPSQRLHGKVVWSLTLLALGAICVAAWIFHDRQKFAAEVAARDELKQLGALVIMDANGKHVQGVNLSLPDVREKLDLAMPLLPKLTYLEVLTLSGTTVTDEQMAHVAPCRNLTSLVLKKTALGDAALVHFARLKQLRTLYLGQTKITTQSLEQIGRLPSLAILELSGTAIDGDLSGLATLGNLQHLLLNGVDLSDAAVETIGHLASLSRLTIVGSNHSVKALEELRQAKPALHLDDVR